MSDVAVQNEVSEQAKTLVDEVRKRGFAAYVSCLMINDLCRKRGIGTDVKMAAVSLVDW
jgi:hypothetical protein